MAEQVEMEKMRPNIRIEIHNNLNEQEPMEVDVDANAKSDNEEGEIVEDNENETLPNDRLVSLPGTDRTQSNLRGIFTTGINIFDKSEQEKLQERARRFALKPDEIRNFTDADLEELHESLGITADNKHNVRFEAVHILGVKDLSTEDILEYFLRYAPAAIEWVSEDSCNVTWPEDISAARAMFYVSKVVRGMPAREPCNPFAKEFLDDFEEPEEQNTGQSILLKNKNRIVELREEVNVHSKINFKNAVDISEITIPIPPGYWRVGEKHTKAKCLLLRFALKTDKKPFNIESFNKYYKHIGTSKGIIPENRKRELRSIFERNRELNKEKNPWGSLAKNWHRDARFCERIPNSNDKPVQIRNSSIHVRLGTKSDEIIEIDDQEEENEENVQEAPTEEIETKPFKKSLKLPRMRMYADDEEEKIKRRKVLQTLKKQTEKLSQDNIDGGDLRNILVMTNDKRAFVREKLFPTERVDLGTRLRNRTQNMVFTVERNTIDVETYERKENLQDIRSLIHQRRDKSLYSRKIISASRLRERRSSVEEEDSHNRTRSSRVRRSRSPLRRSPSRRKRSPVQKRRHERRERQERHEGTLHSDRIHYDRERRPRRKIRNSNRSEEEDEEEDSHKPKSKVAVVIKTQKKPAVASTIWSRVQPPQSESEESESESESSSESGSSQSEDEDSSSSGGSESESDDGDSSSSSSTSVRRVSNRVSRPGFTNVVTKKEKTDFKNPLKITMTNEHFKK